MIEPGTRRSFLVGMAALITAPAIVRAESLMPVKPVYYERFIHAYCIGTDSIMIRADKSLRPLAVPYHCAQILSRAAVERISPELMQRFKLLKPRPGEQLCVDTILGASSELTLGYPAATPYSEMMFGPLEVRA